MARYIVRKTLPIVMVILRKVSDIALRHKLKGLKYWSFDKRMSLIEYAYPGQSDEAW